jgi:hypothetical protein
MAWANGDNLLGGAMGDVFILHAQAEADATFVRSYRDDRVAGL